jgi:large subunit ribosomal protein L39e
LSLPRPDGISARDSWETRGMRRSRLCVFFFLPLTGGGKSRSLRERNFLLRANGRKSGVVVFAPRCERRSRDFRGDLSFVDIRSRERVELCARGGAIDGSCAFTNRQKGGHAQRGFSLFFLLVFHFTHTKTLPSLSLKKKTQPSQKTFKIKKILGKKQKQNRPIPQWIRMKTGNTIRYNAKRRHWRRTKLNI